MKKIIDTVDFDYPSCGGVEVYEGSKWLHFYQFSNYQGNRTNAKGKILKDSTKGRMLLAEIKEGSDFEDEDVESYVDEWYGGFIVE